MKIIMTIGDREYTSSNDWESLEEFHAACANGECGNEFGDVPDFDSGLDATYEAAGARNIRI